MEGREGKEHQTPSPSALTLQITQEKCSQGGRDAAQLNPRLIFPYPVSAASVDRWPDLREDRQYAALGGERGPRAYSFWLLVDLDGQLLPTGRENPGTL